MKVKPSRKSPNNLDVAIERCGGLFQKNETDKNPKNSPIYDCFIGAGFRVVYLEKVVFLGRHAGGHSPLAATFYFLFFGVWLVKLSGLWYSVYWSFVILRRLLYAAEVGYADKGIESV
mgnify:CR=1 FL=1